MQARLRLAAGRVRDVPVRGVPGVTPLESLRIALAFLAGAVALVAGFVAFVVYDEAHRYGGPR